MADGKASAASEPLVSERQHSSIAEQFDKLELQELSEDVSNEESNLALSCELPALSQQIDQIASQVARHSVVGVIVMDGSNLESWERRYGSTAFNAVINYLADITLDVRGNSIAAGEFLCLNGKGGDAVLSFVATPGEDDEHRLRGNFHQIMDKLQVELARSLDRQRLWLQEALQEIAIGSALIIHNSSVSPKREVYRSIRKARTNARANYEQRQRRKKRIVGEIIAGKNIETVYQPVVTLDEGRVVGYEALSRSMQPLKKELDSQLFVAACQADLSGELDRTCRWLAIERSPQLDKEGRLFVNCLPPTFFSPRHDVHQLIDDWKDRGLDPEQMTLEVTENMTQDQVERILPAVQKLRSRGVEFALDDMGTGITNLRLLADLDPNYIKMDISLTRDIDQSSRKKKLAEYLLELGRGSNARVIAEGIETEAERETLLELGFTYGQGYLFERPTASEAVTPIQSEVGDIASL